MLLPFEHQLINYDLRDELHKQTEHPLIGFKSRVYQLMPIIQ